MEEALFRTDSRPFFAQVPAGEYAAYAGIGSRQTPADVCAHMTAIARALEARGFTLRSGGAPGADGAFEAGVIDPCKKEIYLPAVAWRGSASELTPEGLGAATWEQAREIAMQFHPAWRRLRPGHAQALQTRNTFQVLGRDLRSPVRFVMAWTVDGLASGGTGQAMRIAAAHGVPIFNLRDDDCRRATLQALSRPCYRSAP